VRILVVLLLGFLIVGCGGETGDTNSRSAKTTPDSKLRTVTIESSNGDKVEVRVEIADDDAERAQGLMGRTALGDDRGMLFVFGEEQHLLFWMRNTLIPLSIAFMDSEERIVDIQDMKPLDDDPPHYVSTEPARYALEVNQGFFEERGVEVGDRANLPE
jgi:uncharacterized membrane protein (UPF0127 family)